jgi:hypothetical protein
MRTYTTSTFILLTEDRPYFNSEFSFSDFILGVLKHKVYNLGQSHNKYKNEKNTHYFFNICFSYIVLNI